MKTLVTLLTIGILAAGSNAYALTNTEDWNSGANGWYEGSGAEYSIFWADSGGVDDSGCYQSTRLSLLACLWPSAAPATTNFTGDLEALYGNNLITFSYDAKDFAGNATCGVWHVFYNGNSYWSKQLLDAGPTEWTAVSAVIDTDWTDAQANLYGWNLMGGSGSWTDLLHSVAEQWLFYGNGWLSGETHAGVDNFTMMSGGTLMVIYPGDANKNGVVNEDDAATLATNWLLTGTAKWADGDFNYDGNVDDIDATLMATNWLKGSTSPGASVPEPSILSLVAAGLLVVGLLRRKAR